MKLTYVANIRLPTEKAHGAQIMNMCEAFALAGAEVELLVPTRRTDITDNPYDHYMVRQNFKIRKLWCLDAVNFGKIGFLIETLSFSLSVGIYVLCRQGLFYTRDETEALILRLLGKRVFWEVHMGQKNFIVRMLLRLRIPLIAITHGLKDTYIRMGVPAERICVAHDAFDPDRFQDIPPRRDVRDQLGLPTDKIIIGYVGKYKTLGETKGVEDLVSPFKQLLTKHPESFLLIVGPETSEVAEIEVELKEKVVPNEAYRIVSRVPHGGTSVYMRAADLLVLPYPNTPHYAHNMSPLKLFSYMGSGSAILASDLPSLREVLDDSTSFFFDPDVVASLYQALSYCICHPEEREAKAQQALEESKKYTWRGRAEHILAFLNS